MVTYPVVRKKLGCVDEKQWIAFDVKRATISAETQRLKSVWVGPRLVADAEAQRLLGTPLEREYALADLLRRPNVSYADLMSLRGIAGEDLAGPGLVDKLITEQIEIQLKYAGYIERQAKEVQRHEYHENMTIPAQFDYLAIQALSMEVRQKLDQQRPQTLGQASRISGVTPAAISLLLVHLKKHVLTDITAHDAAV